MSKAPEQLLRREQLEALTGFARKKLLKLFTDPNEWAKPGGTKVIAGEYRLPVPFYNRWVESKELAQPAKREVARV